jgi:hypothetical protein
VVAAQAVELRRIFAIDVDDDEHVTHRVDEAAHQGSVIPEIARQRDQLYPGMLLPDLENAGNTAIGRAVVGEDQFEAVAISERPHDLLEPAEEERNAVFLVENRANDRDKRSFVC